MMDQRNKYAPKGISTDFVGGEQVDPDVREKVLKGKVQLVFITPESIIRNDTYRNMLLSAAYQENMVALVVDEAHCIKTWGTKFRTTFSEIGTLRSLIPRQVKILALTATATTETFSIVSKTLSMQAPNLISLPPQRDNIIYEVVGKVTKEIFISRLSQELRHKKTSFPKTVVYVRKYPDCYGIFNLLKFKLGADMTYPSGYPDAAQFRLLDMFSSVATTTKKEEVLELFSQSGGHLRLIVSTTAFGMGIDCGDIRRIIHWGIPANLEEYVQECGRAGRDGRPSVAVLYQGVGGRDATAGMKSYVNNSSRCRRIMLFEEFIAFRRQNIGVSGCKCCDLVAIVCECVSCST